jgi:hypothetical protein
VGARLKELEKRLAGIELRERGQTEINGLIRDDLREAIDETSRLKEVNKKLRDYLDLQTTHLAAVIILAGLDWDQVLRVSHQVMADPGNPLRQNTEPRKTDG